MAVYTEVSTREARTLFKQLDLGQVSALRACPGGIENTNYFVSVERDGQTYDYVLTVFERLNVTQLPFYLGLMKHLAQRGLAVPQPQPNARGELVFQVQGKPAAVVNKLSGNSELKPGPAHCSAVGAMLARMHLAGRDFALAQPNLRGLPWCQESAPAVLPYLNASQSALLQGELAYQNHIVQSSSYAALPRGPIHADLFRDNVMFDGASGELDLSGILDFYFAGVDSWLLDLAVALNDWSIDPETSVQQAQNAHSMIASYNAIRPLQGAERALLAAMLRAAALRFWLSRLLDFHLPRAARLLTAHDPGHFERVLRERVSQPGAINLQAMSA
jgi:homoserine kinase type II